MDKFAIYFDLGLRHMVNFQPAIHISWVLAIVVVFQLIQLRRMILLVTIFALTHSLGLLLATLGWLTINRELVGILIPALLLVLSITNIIMGTSARNAPLLFRIILISAYGILHGLGYDSYLNMLTSSEGSDFIPTLAFDIGIEAGQLIVVALIQIISVLAFHFFHIRHRDWILVWSGACGGIAIMALV